MPHNRPSVVFHSATHVPHQNSANSRRRNWRWHGSRESNDCESKTNTVGERAVWQIKLMCHDVWTCHAASRPIVISKMQLAALITGALTQKRRLGCAILCARQSPKEKSSRFFSFSAAAARVKQRENAIQFWLVKCFIARRGSTRDITHRENDGDK